MSVEPVVSGPLYFTEFQHGQRVNGFPHEVPSGGGILTLGVLEGFLYLTEKFAVMLWVPLSFFGCSLMCLHIREWSVSQSAWWLLQVERTLLRLVITRSSWCHLRDQGCFHLIWCCNLQGVGYVQIVNGAKFQKSLSIFVHTAENRDVQDKGTRLRKFQLEIQRAGDFLVFCLDLSGARLIHLSCSELLGPKHRSRQSGSWWVSP